MQTRPESLLRAGLRALGAPLAKLPESRQPQDLTEALLRLAGQQDARLSRLDARLSQLEQNLVRQVEVTGELVALVQAHQHLSQRLAERLDAVEAVLRLRPRHEAPHAESP